MEDAEKEILELFLDSSYKNQELSLAIASGEKKPKDVFNNEDRETILKNANKSREIFEKLSPKEVKKVISSVSGSSFEIYFSSLSPEEQQKIETTEKKALINTIKELSKKGLSDDDIQLAKWLGDGSAFFDLGLDKIREEKSVIQREEYHRD